MFDMACSSWRVSFWYIDSVSETGHRDINREISIDECESAARRCVRIDVRRQYPFHLVSPIITSEKRRDRDTHRSLFMSNMHF